MTTFTDHFVPSATGRLFARVWGGERVECSAALLLFHDSLGSVELWRDFPQRLASATGRAVVAYDRLGFGKSDPRVGPLPHDFMQDEARTSVPAVISALGVESFVPFGHSVGGTMAVATAVRFADRCPAVITESAQAFVEDRTRAGIRAAQEGFAKPGQLERLERYHGDKARWVLDAWIETWLSPAFADWRLEGDLRQLRCPVLAMHGDRDEYGSAKHPETIGRAPSSPTKVVLFENCGHVPHRQRPDEVLSQVTDFLRHVE